MVHTTRSNALFELPSDPYQAAVEMLLLIEKSGNTRIRVQVISIRHALETDFEDAFDRLVHVYLRVVGTKVPGARWRRSPGTGRTRKPGSHGEDRHN